MLQFGQFSTLKILTKMANLDYCFNGLGEHERIQCARWQKGGIDGIFLFYTDATITNYNLLANYTALINAGTGIKIQNIKGEIPDGSPVEGDNPIGCGSDTVIDGFDFTITYMDYNVNADNDALYANLNGQTVYAAVHLCGEDDLLIIEEAITIVALPANVPTSQKEKQRYSVTLKFSTGKDYFPIRIASPVGLF